MFGTGPQLDREYEADSHAVSKGFDMLGLLEYLYDTYPQTQNRAVRKRIARLKTLVA